MQLFKVAKDLQERLNRHFPDRKFNINPMEEGQLEISYDAYLTKEEFAKLINRVDQIMEGKYPEVQYKLVEMAF